MQDQTGNESSKGINYHRSCFLQNESTQVQGILSPRVDNGSAELFIELRQHPHKSCVVFVWIHKIYGFYKDFISYF